MFICLFVCLFVCLLNVNAQECGTEPQLDYKTYDSFNDARISNSSSTVSEKYCINVCFRIARNNDGSNASFNPSNIPQALALLNLRFNLHGIFFNQVGTYDYINNTILNSATGAVNIINIPNALNIIFVKTVVQGQNVTGIANFQQNKIRILGSSGLSEALPHEVGHCLNLEHTFKCTSTTTGFDSNCAENPLNTDLNTNGCNTRGDMVCDTPADYTTSPPLNNANNPYGLSNYNPDKKNIMSYWYNEVRDRFTSGQGVRMKNSIIGSSYLQNIRSNDCYSIKGSRKLCRNQSSSYSVSGATTATTTYNWSVTSGLQINGSSTNATVNVSRSGNVGTFILTVTINGTIIKTKTIRKCGWGWWFSRPVGVYDWVSIDFGNMGLIIPTDPEGEDFEDPLVSYLWEIKENIKPETTTTITGNKPYFIGANATEPYKFTSTTNQAVVNWGSLSNSYLISCKEITASGEMYLLSENYVDVGDPKNNPCFKNTITTTVAPNPVNNGLINVIVNKPEQTAPCNFRSVDEPQFFNSKLDEINNSITIFDYNGNEVYSSVFETNEFTIDDANLISGNNYIVNLFTNEGGFTQQVIIVE